MHITKTLSEVGVKNFYLIFCVYFHRSLCWRECAWVSKRRHSPEHFYWWPPRLSQPDGSAAWLQVFLQVRDTHNPEEKPHNLIYKQTVTHHCLVFCVSTSDAKKKLRLALCSADSVALPIMAPATTRNGLPDHMEPEGRSPYAFIL